MPKLLATIAVFLLFTAYSVYVMTVEPSGYFGFLELALRERWAAQMLGDLAIACGLFALWMVRDGQARRIPTWPYLLLTFSLGSIGALSYLIHRELKAYGERTLRTTAS